MSLNPVKHQKIESLANLLPAFEFEHLIAVGSMGAVYKARQRSLDRDVAIKILPRELGDDPLFRTSFQDEAKAMARLTHPNLIRVYDSGDLNGLLYIVMEYVPGKSLFHSAHGKAIDSTQAVEIVIAACRGLAHAHENGIIHRDIKPANILLTPKCEPKIGDFGLARCSRADVDGLPMGTPEYMAPEILNHPVKGDPQSDVFAIGVVLRELLTGIPAGTEDGAKQVVSDVKLATICRKATQVDPALRYPDASSLAQELTCWMASKSSQAVVKKRQPTRQRPMPGGGRPLSAQQRPMPAQQRPMPTGLAKQNTSRNWALLKSFASITFILCSGYLAWGVYQTKNEALARLQHKTTKSSIQSLAAESGFTPSRNLLTTPSAAHQESSLESLVRFGTSLVADNFQ